MLERRKKNIRFPKKFIVIFIAHLTKVQFLYRKSKIHLVVYYKFKWSNGDSMTLLLICRKFDNKKKYRSCKLVLLIKSCNSQLLKTAQYTFLVSLLRLVPFYFLYLYFIINFFLFVNNLTSLSTTTNSLRYCIFVRTQYCTTYSIV